MVHSARGTDDKRRESLLSGIFDLRTQLPEGIDQWCYRSFQHPIRAGQDLLTGLKGQEGRHEAKAGASWASIKYISTVSQQSAHDPGIIRIGQSRDLVFSASQMVYEQNPVRNTF